MFNKIKKSLESKKANLEIINYYEKIGWEINKYFVTKVQPIKKEKTKNKYQSQLLKNGLKIIILINELINKLTPNIMMINEISIQVNEINNININEKNINIDLIFEILIRYYVLLPYIYVCQSSDDYIKNNPNVNLNLLTKKIRKHDLNKIISKSPKIIDIWKAITNEPELLNKFPSNLINIFDNYIKY